MFVNSFSIFDREMTIKVSGIFGNPKPEYPVKGYMTAGRNS